MATEVSTQDVVVPFGSFIPATIDNEMRVWTQEAKKIENLSTIKLSLATVPDTNELKLVLVDKKIKEMSGFFRLELTAFAYDNINKEPVSQKQWHWKIY